MGEAFYHIGLHTVQHYPFRSIEAKWQRYWNQNKTHQTPHRPTQKHYVLEMMPYPSGRIHVGHVRNYTLGDAFARFKRACGYQVMHPMAWDAFGLPAENAAIERQISPSRWTYANINDMRMQLKNFGFSYDWSLEATTCDPSYYRHEQEMFITFFEKGLIERRKGWVNWDPVDQCVLANEQVVDGRGWRSNAPIERRSLAQWFFKITSYAEELQHGIDTGALSAWPDKVSRMQSRWLHRRQGYLAQLHTSGMERELSIFVQSKADLKNVYAVLLPYDHPWVLQSDCSDVRAFVSEAMKTPMKEEAMATHTKRWCNLGISLAKEGPPIVAANWICGDPTLLTEPTAIWQRPYSIQASHLEEHVAWRLRDWLVSRQRYWGCPIPMIHCVRCGVVPAHRRSLPIVLPDDAPFTGKENPLDQHPTWKHTTCPKCGAAAERDTNTLDTFFESSWYFLRCTTPPGDNARPFDPERVRQWMSVDTYIGGIEHAIMHLLYARFFHKVLIDCGYISPHVLREPFVRLITQGMVCHKTYRAQDGTWLYPDEVEQVDTGYATKEGGCPVEVGRSEKMSKSKRNVVDCEAVLSAYGADTVRLFILSDTPPEKDLEWNESALKGAWRYMNRLWRLQALAHTAMAESTQEEDVLPQLAHQLLEKMTAAYEQLAYNNIIAWHRELVSAFEAHALKSRCVREVWQIIIQTIAPITPHIAHELWPQDGLVLDAAWPMVDKTLTQLNQHTIAVQINGKLRATLVVEAHITQEALQSRALDLSAIQLHMKGQIPKRVIVIPGKVVNIVL